MKLLIDLDGVCCNLYGRLSEWYNRDYNDNVQPGDIKHWALSRTFKKATRDEIYSYFDVPGFWENLDPIPGCREVLSRLSEYGHELVIVTAVPRESSMATIEKIRWVEKNLPFIGGINNFVATRRKDLVRGDLLLDDGPHNIRRYPGRTCAMDAPYNRKEKADFRVSNWEEFENLIEDLNEG